MNVYLSWFLSVLGGLLGVAVLVAWWEHLQRHGDRRSSPASPTPPPVQSVDVSLESVVEVERGRVATETGNRRAAFDQAFSRMSAPVWLDTQPRVTPGSADASARRHEPTPSVHG